MHLSQIVTLLECLETNGGYAIWNGNRAQRGTTEKGMLANGLYVLMESNVFGGNLVREHSVFYLYDACGNLDTLQH